MATPPELIKAVSDATGIPTPTVFDLDRRLVKGRLRPVGGRGPNAVKLEPLHAARLLTALLASPQSNEAAEAVLRYAETKPDKARSSDGLFAAAGLEDLATLPVKHGFVDGLAALITSAAIGSLRMPTIGRKPGPHIEVFAFTRATLGRIRISGLPNGLTASVEYVQAKGHKSNASIEGSAQAGDLEQSRRITEHTIVSIAKLFGELK